MWWPFCADTCCSPRWKIGAAYRSNPPWEGLSLFNPIRPWQVIHPFKYIVVSAVLLLHSFIIITFLSVSQVPKTKKKKKRWNRFFTPSFPEFSKTQQLLLHFRRCLSMRSGGNRLDCSGDEFLERGIDRDNHSLLKIDRKDRDKKQSPLPTLLLGRDASLVHTN